MATCKDCYFYKYCGGFIPTDLDKDVFDYCRQGKADEIPDIDERCSSFTRPTFIHKLFSKFKKGDKK